MARIGLAIPTCATYTANQGVVTYSNGFTLGRAVEAQIELEDTDPIVLYADNVAAESVASFSTGTLTLTIDELSVENAGKILGIVPTTVTTPSGTAISFDSNQATPYLGLGLIVKKIVNNTMVHQAIILRKVQFRVPAGDYTTQGENVEFQTPELEATIMKDDTSSGTWQKWGEFASQDDALTWIRSELNISAPEPATTT